jgi:DNA (cytosine-5)-methyltransferase 1
VKVLDLFSGIGGFSLGLERAGMETVAFCEIKPYCQRWLKQQWPGVPIFDDVKKLGAQDVGSVDVICGGFPCQDLSSAGLQRGFEGERSSLYGEMLRVISECKPRYAIFENVANFLVGEQGRWFAKFLYDLATIGYDAEWHCISASAIGANHHRDRVWIVAYPTGNSKQSSIFAGCETELIFKSKPRGSSWNPIPGTHWATPQPGITEVDDGISSWVGPVSGYGNAVVPQIPEIIGKAIMAAEGKLND